MDARMQTACITIRSPPTACCVSRLTCLDERMSRFVPRPLRAGQQRGRQSRWYQHRDVSRWRPCHTCAHLPREL
eukprot:6209038-Pleurochrysis_carterae.AAC.6